MGRGRDADGARAGSRGRRAPGTWRRLLGLLASAYVSVALCWWALAEVDGDALLDALRDTAPGPVAAASLAYLAAFYTVEIAGSLLTYRRHLGAAVPLRHATVLAGGRHLRGVASPLLIKGVATAYFRRRWRVPEPEVDEASELVSFADAVATVGLALGGIVAGAAGVPAALVVGLAGCGVLLVADLVWAWGPWSRAPSRLHQVAVFRALARAPARQLIALVALRVALGLVAVGALDVLLAAVGQRLSPGQLVLLGALLANSALMPLSVAGLGGPQLVAVLLPVEAWDVPAADAVALSLLWSATFLVGRLAVGAALAPSLRRLLHPGAHVARRRARPARVRPAGRHDSRVATPAPGRATAMFGPERPAHRPEQDVPPPPPGARFVSHPK